MSTEVQKSETTIYQKAVQGSMWLFAFFYLNRGLELVRAVILARLLMPRDFGQMAIAVLCVTILGRFTEIGATEALIQHKEDIHEHLDTAWTLGILRGLFIFGLLLILAPWIAFFFDGPGRLRETDIKAERMVSRMQTRQDPAILYLWEHLPEESREFLSSYKSGGVFPQDEKERLLQGLNRILASEPLWQIPSFSDIPLSDMAQKILAQKIQAGDRLRANRVLLEEIFAENKAIQPVILDQKLVTRIIQMTGFIFLIGSMKNIGIVFFRRDLQFAQQFLFGLSGVLAGAVSAIVIAAIYRSVWALVIGQLAGTAISSVLSYVFHAYRPRLQLKLRQIRALWKYGQHVMGTSIVELLMQQGDAVVVGKMLGTSTLGLYRYAIRFSTFGVSEIQGVVRQVTFPAFSRLQGDLKKIISGYKKTIRYITVLAYPVSGGLFVLSHEFISVVLGTAWIDMVPTLRILCILSALFCVHTGVIYHSQGRPDMQTKVSAIRLLFIAVTIYPLTQWMGLPGTALSILASLLLVFPLQFKYLKQLIGVSLMDFIRLVLVPLTATIIMAVSLALLKPWIPMGNLGRLLILVPFGALLYLIVVCLLSRFDREYSPRQFYIGLRKGWN